MTTDGSAEQLANVSTNLTALADARARVRIDATERDTDTVGFVLGQYRTQAGLAERELADWLGIEPDDLVRLAVDRRPAAARADLTYDRAQIRALAIAYGAHPDRLLVTFEQGDS